MHLTRTRFVQENRWTGCKRTEGSRPDVGQKENSRPRRAGVAQWSSSDL